MKFGFKYIEHKRINNEIYIGFICPKHENKGIQYIVYRNFKKSVYGCPYCYGLYQTTDDLKHDKRIKSSIEILGDYVRNNIKVLCKCKDCGNEWNVTPNKLKMGKGCPVCANRKNADKLRKTQIQYEAEVYLQNPNIEITGKYTGANNKIKCKCKIHKIEWASSAWQILKNIVGCPICNSSVGELKISMFLIEQGIPYIPQHKFIDCVFKDKLRFDFYLPKNNICIEFQGEQHYFPVNFRGKHYFDYKNDFELTKIKDNIKREYCKRNQIRLIEIPYWERENISNYLICELNIAIFLDIDIIKRTFVVP